MACAVAHPCDESSLRGAVEAGQMGLFKPVLVGPKARIEAVAAALAAALACLAVVLASALSLAFATLGAPSIDRSIALALHDHQPRERLNAGQVDAASLQRVLVVQRDGGERG